MIAESYRCLEVNLSLKSDWEATRTMRYTCCSGWREAFCLEPIKVGDTVVWLFPEDLGSEDQEALARRFATGTGTTGPERDGELTRGQYVAWKDSFKA